MSSIEKLLIQGVRSFHPDTHQVIDFHGAPVTLIVGQNGSGKTTIIEVLKYVCTGSFPPAVQGKQWLFDPKVRGASDTKALIRLKLRDQANNKIEVSRRLEVVQNRKTQTFKSKESTIVKTDPVTKEKVQISSKCAEIDREMELRMGVSGAVLENVIFCHQEDSNWPLNPPNDLKKRFDAIFSATRYIKALEEIKKTTKSEKQNLVAFGINLEHLKDKKELALQLEEQYRLTKSRYESVGEKISDLEVQRDNIQVQKTMATSKVEELQVKRNTIGLKEKDVENAKNQLRRIEEEGLEILSEDTAVLEDKRLEFERCQKHDAGELDKMKEKYEKLCKRQLSLQTKIDQEREALGEFRNAQKIHEEKKVKLGARINNLAAKWNIEDYEGAAFSDTRVNLFSQRLEEIQRTKDSELKMKKEKSSEEHSRLQSRLDEIRSNIAQTNERLNTYNKDQKQYQKEIKACKDSLTQMQRDSGSLDMLNEQRQNNITALHSVEDKYKSENYDNKISEMKKEIRTKQQEIDRLTELQQQIVSQIALYTKITQLEKTITQDKHKWNTLLTNRETQLSNLFGVPVSPRNVLRQYESRHLALTEEVRKLRSEYSSCKDIVVKCESQRDAKRESLSKLQDQKKTYRRKMKNLCGDMAYEAVLDAAQKKVEEAEDIFRYGITASSIVKKANESTGQKQQSILPNGEVQTGKSRMEHGCCPTCKREYDSQSAFEAFLKFWKSKLDALSQVDVEELKRTKESAMQEYNTIAALENDNTRLAELEAESIPELEKEICNLDTQINEVSAKLQEIEVKQAAEELKLEELESTRSDCGEIERLGAKIAKDDAAIVSEKSKLYSNDSGMDNDEVSAKLAELNDSIGHIRKGIERLEKARDIKKNEIQNAKNDVHEAEKRIKDHELIVKDQAQKEDAIFSLQEKLNEIIMKKSNEEKERVPQNKRLQEANEIQEKHKNESEREFNECQKELESINSDIREIKRMVEEVNSYIRNGKESSLQDCDTRLNEALATFEERKKEADTQQEQISALTEKVATEKIRQKQILENLAYRRYEKEKRDFNTILQKLKADLENLESDGYEEELRTLEEQENNINLKISGHEGELGVLRQKAQEHRDELRKPVYRGAHQEYRETLIKKETTNATLDDLKTYYTALDNAVVSFHAMRMKEINESVKDLWESTYRGGDIDYIEILSSEDAEGAKGKINRDMESRKSYNYRVVMVKGRQKLDMRGRCSAGQKVLASIIIRLALADTFCLQCGVFTLDEPTTNLDAENIDSLAAGLSQIIVQRRNQSNFQMLIITHDEQFVQQLGRNGCTDTYYHISKEPCQDGSGILCSSIKKREIRHLDEHIQSDDEGNNSDF